MGSETKITRNNSSIIPNVNNSSRKFLTKVENQDSANNKTVTDSKRNNCYEKRKLTNHLKTETDISKRVSFNVIHHFNRSMRGDLYAPYSDKLQKRIIMNQLKRFSLYQMHSPFERRVTYVTWHPSNSQFVAVGSKGGELMLLNVTTAKEYFHPGVGAGGSIVGMKFSQDDICTVYTASITGNIRKEDLTGKNSQTLLSTLTWENWFSCLDVCYNRNFIMTGDCSGNAYLLTTTGQMIWKSKLRLHSSKITHCEFNMCDPNLFVTASVDHSVKLWDLRMISNCKLKPEPLRMFPHQKAVNSAYFSPCNGLSLLTTDQHSELQVYSSPCWDETVIIKHPHRQFQHITPIKATWHPMKDIIIVGRYPDDSIFPDDTRTIDFYDASDGELMHRMKSPSGNIVSINAFNNIGDTLASAAGFNMLFLKDENFLKYSECVHKRKRVTDENQPNLPKRRQAPRSASQNKNANSKNILQSNK